MKKLPIGMQSFRKLRENNCLYVDKTEILQRLVENGSWYFLSRPSRFGKSLTLSTLEEMFKGNVNLFNGLKAEQWVIEQAEHPAPVLRFDMSDLDSTSIDNLKRSIIAEVEDNWEDYDLKLNAEATPSRMLKTLIRTLYKQYGAVVVLIDEYDKPVAVFLYNAEKL